MDIEDFVRKALLDNAQKHDGHAHPGAVMGAVMREFPEFRGKAKEVQPILARIATEVNALSAEEQASALEELGGSGAPVREKMDPFDLGTKPVVRFEPSPSGPMHIGHTYPLGLNHLLAVRNDGRLILRIADTNPENIYEGAYELLPADAKWYTHDNIDEVHVQSDRMELYYSYAERMLTEGWAYVCTCDSDSFRKLVNNKEACPCRDLPPAQHLERWQLMLTDFEPGDAVVRIKTDVTHKNPAMRDWPALRINTSVHPRQGTKYRVWPLMNFSVSVDDMEMGMTHVLRAKDHADNAKRQEFMYRYFDKPIPKVYNVGRINFTDLRLSTTETRKSIEEGKFSGWDDIRLPFLPALRRRGFQPEAFLRLAEEMGFSATDKKVSKAEYFRNIEAFNREIIDPIADRAFFIPDPVDIVIEGAPEFPVRLDLHPTERKGGRSLAAGPKVVVPANDLEDADGVLFRLMDAYNFRRENGAWVFVSKSIEEFRKAKRRRIVQWLPADDADDARVHMPDGSWMDGAIEPRDFISDSLYQFERFGFVRCDDMRENRFWFAHQ